MAASRLRLRKVKVRPFLEVILFYPKRNCQNNPAIRLAGVNVSLWTTITRSRFYWFTPIRFVWETADDTLKHVHILVNNLKDTWPILQRYNKESLSKLVSVKHGLWTADWG